MTIQGNAAVKGEMNRLLALMDEVRDLPPEEQLAQLRKEIEEVKAAADSGWL